LGRHYFGERRRHFSVGIERIGFPWFQATNSIGNFKGGVILRFGSLGL